MSKILVTGAEGQLGTMFKRFSGRCGKEHSWVFTDMAEMDITDANSVAVYIEKEKPDAMINCAAWTDVEGAETNREEAFRINAEGPRILASVAARTKTVFIHISTDFVFDGSKKEPYTEDDVPAPLNVYGESKLAGEQAVEQTRCNGAIIRTSWLYTPFGHNFVKSILAAAKNGGELRVVEDQFGSPTAGRGLAAAITEIISQLIAIPAFAEVYHYCDSGITSRFEFAREILRQSGLKNNVVPVSSSEYPSAAERPAYSVLDTGKIRRNFGIVSFPWQETLTEVLQTINELK